MISTSLKMAPRKFGYIYPGPPADQIAGVKSVINEVIDNEIKYVRPEYLTIDNDGDVILIEEEEWMLNAYSPAMVAQLKSLTDIQYVTVSGWIGGGAGVMLDDETKRAQAVVDLVSYAGMIGCSGLGIDFEPAESFTSQEFSNFVLFMADLANGLHGIGQVLAVDTVGFGSDWGIPWSNSDLNIIGVDYFFLMCYDAQFGPFTAVAPPGFIADQVSFLKNDLGADFEEKMVLGVPSYGYRRQTGGQINILTRQQFIDIANSNSIDISDLDTPREESDPDWNLLGHEKLYVINGENHVMTSIPSMDYMYEVARDENMWGVSVWHLGGNNPWFTAEPTPPPTPEPTPPPTPEPTPPPTPEPTPPPTPEPTPPPTPEPTPPPTPEPTPPPSPGSEQPGFSWPNPNSIRIGFLTYTMAIIKVLKR